VTVEGAFRSPLHGREGDLASVEAVEVVGLAQVAVRCAPEEAARFGFPLEPNTAVGDAMRSSLWLGPDEWLVVDAAREATALVAELAAPHRSVVDVSANRAVIELVSALRLELLAGGCGLDLDPRGGWIAGRCAQTLFARAPVLLQELPGATRVFVRPSLAGYLVDRLAAGRFDGAD
jgi:sarcosine oxidase subunit gamma